MVVAAGCGFMVPLAVAVYNNSGAVKVIAIHSKLVVIGAYNAVGNVVVLTCKAAASAHTVNYGICGVKVSEIFGGNMTIDSKYTGVCKLAVFACNNGAAYVKAGTYRPSVPRIAARIVCRSSAAIQMLGIFMVHIFYVGSANNVVKGKFGFIELVGYRITVKTRRFVQNTQCGQGKLKFQADKISAKAGCLSILRPIVTAVDINEPAAACINSGKIGFAFTVAVIKGG